MLPGSPPSQHKALTASRGPPNALSSGSISLSAPLPTPLLSAAPLECGPLHQEAPDPPPPPPSLLECHLSGVLFRRAPPSGQRALPPLPREPPFAHFSFQTSVLAMAALTTATEKLQEDKLSPALPLLAHGRCSIKICRMNEAGLVTEPWSCPPAPRPRHPPETVTVPAGFIQQCPRVWPSNLPLNLLVYSGFHSLSSPVGHKLPKGIWGVGLILSIDVTQHVARAGEPLFLPRAI